MLGQSNKERNMTFKELKIQLALGTLPTYIKYGIVSDLDTSRRILKLFTKDNDIWIRGILRFHPNVSSKMLHYLTHDPTLQERGPTKQQAHFYFKNFDNCWVKSNNARKDYREGTPHAGSIREPSRRIP